MKLYLDNCCFNRPFDDQSQLRIKIEAEAKLKIQDEIRAGKFQLVWSYILEFENNNNPYEEKTKQISEWKAYAVMNVQENPQLLYKANAFVQKGFRTLDALHVACAIVAECDYFLTTDDKVLKKDNLVEEIDIVDPFVFVKEAEL